MTPTTAEQMPDFAMLLNACMEKIDLFREKHGAEYLGGWPLTRLRSEVSDAIAWLAQGGARGVPEDMVIVPREIVANYAVSTGIPRHRRICEAALAPRAEAGGVPHGHAAASIELATREVLVPCDCGCGRSCCAHCGVDLGFIAEIPDDAPVNKCTCGPNAACSQKCDRNEVAALAPRAEAGEAKPIECADGCPPQSVCNYCQGPHLADEDRKIPPTQSEVFERIIQKTVAGIAGQREQILTAFIAEHGCYPSECVQITDGTGWRVIKRDAMYLDPKPTAACGVSGLDALMAKWRSEDPLGATYADELEAALKANRGGVSVEQIEAAAAAWCEAENNALVWATMHDEDRMYYRLYAREALAAALNAGALAGGEVVAWQYRVPGSTVIGEWTECSLATYSAVKNDPKKWAGWEVRSLVVGGVGS